MATEQNRIDSSETLREALAAVNESLAAIEQLYVVTNEVTWSSAKQELTDAFAKLQAAIAR